MELLKNLNMSNSSLKNEFMTQRYMHPPGKSKFDNPRGPMEFHSDVREYRLSTLFWYVPKL